MATSRRGATERVAGAGAGSGGVRGPDRGERGIALLAVITVLVLLTIIATPFLVTMRNGAERGQTLLASAQATAEAENVFRVATAFLTARTDVAETMAREEGRKDAPATPGHDTLDEIRIPDELLESAGLNREGGRIWGVDVQDEQARININSAPFTTLAYYFGISTLARAVTEADQEIELAAPGGLPARGGVVRIGDEVIRYARMDGNLLRGLERGYRADRPANGPARAHGVGALVVNEIAFQIAAHPILARRTSKKTEFAPYTNLYEMRRIADVGVAAMTAEEWEAVAEDFTVHSRGDVGQVWADAQTLRNPVKAGEDGHRAILTVDNPYRFGIGTVVRVTDGVRTDYAIVYDVGGKANVSVVPALQNDYDAAVTRVESLVRHPVNINTASRRVLTAITANVGRHGQRLIDAGTAQAVADRIIRARPVKSMREYALLLTGLATDAVIDAEQATALGMSGLLPTDAAPSRLAVGSVPVTFRSGDVYTVTARAVVLDTGGRELGRRQFRRLVEVNPRTSAVALLRTQEDLDRVLVASSSKYVTTFPVNVSPYDGANIPASRFIPFFRNDRFPSADPADSKASVRLLPSRPVWGSGIPDSYHYDGSDYADGYYLEESHASFATDDGRVAIASDQGMEPFSVGLWFKPYWGGRRTAYVFDTGKDNFEDRVVVFYDAETRELVCRVSDAAIQRQSAEIRYPFDLSTWEDDRWYHVRVSANGSRPGEFAMFIDGERRGNPTLLTYLTQSVAGDDTVSTLSVEDASSFPTSGALLLRGPNGVEVMEYSSRTKTSFTIERRWARINRADSIDDPNGTLQLTHDAGQAVYLYGYSIPLLSNIPAGSGTLPADLGQFAALLLTAENPPDTWPNTSGGGGGGPEITSIVGAAAPGVLATGAGGASPSMLLEGGGSGLPVLRGWRGAKIDLQVNADLTSWDGRPISEAIRAFGTAGYAILCSGTGTSFYPAGQSSDLMIDCELVSYRVTGGTLSITRRPEPTKNLAGSIFDKSSQSLRFMPRHTYGDEDDPFSQWQEANPNFKPIYDHPDITDVGIITVLVPISIEVAGASETTFLNPHLDGGYLPASAFAQINTADNKEWIRYDVAERHNAVSSNLLLVRDRTAVGTFTSLFRTRNLNGGQINPPGDDTDPPETPPVDPPPPGGDEPPAPPPPPPGEDGGGGGGPDTPPVPPTDDGGGDEDDGGGGTPDTPPLPPDPGGGDEDGPGGGDPDIPPTPPDPGGGDEDGPGGGEPDVPPTPPEDPGGDEDGGGGGEPDTPPPPPGDEGPGEPPPDPGPGDPGDGDPDDGAPPPVIDDPDNPGTGTGGTLTTTTPFGLDEIARPLDTRPTAVSTDPAPPTSGAAPGATVGGATASSAGGVFIADSVASAVHPAGTLVLPCFLVAFPGVEYDPQGDDSTKGQTGVNASTGTGGGPSGPQITSGGNLGPAGSSTADPGDPRVDGRFVEPGPGRGDVVTVVIPGGDKIERTINHSYHASDRSYSETVANANVAARTWTWTAFSSAVDVEVVWSRGRLGAHNYVWTNMQTGAIGDRRTFVRLVKAPSGEMPSSVATHLNVGARFDNSGFASAVIDEVHFVSRRNAPGFVNQRKFLLGERPAIGQRGRGIGENDVDIPLHPYAGYTAADGVALGFRETGGLVQVNGEIIAYSRFDSAGPTLVGCERGAMGSEARAHSYGSPLIPINGIAVARVEDNVSESSDEIPLASSLGFPVQGGYVRIGDEILGYTRIDESVLKMPAARAKRDESFAAFTSGGRKGAMAGAGLFRGRFGTKPAGHDVGSLAYLHPHRYEDRSVPYADDPQMAFFEVSREAVGAIWKRVSFDSRLRPLVRLRVLVRFDGGPAWDSDRVIRMDQDAVPEKGRRDWLYEITDPTKMNLLNVQADRIHCRVFFEYEPEAYARGEGVAMPDAWKETAWLKAFRIEYLAPPGVLSTEDLR